MAKTLSEVQSDVMRRLGDTSAQIWSSGEVQSLIREGYNELAIRTKCFWDFRYLDDLPYTANYTGSWEKNYLTVAHNQFSHTDDWESAYDNTGLDPGNHTSAWEWDYITTQYVSALNELPENCYEIERATWDSQRLVAATHHELSADPRYEFTEGRVSAYSHEKDGLRKIRKYRKPSTTTDRYTFTGQWGIARDVSDVDSSTPTGTWGVLRFLSGQAATGGPWGLVRSITIESSDSMKIEFFRRGDTLTGVSSKLEFPDVYVKYVRHYVMGRALERKGPGQDVDLANHYLLRFESGVERIRKRKSRIASMRTMQLGGAVNIRRRPPRPKLPWAYGRVAR